MTNFVKWLEEKKVTSFQRPSEHARVPHQVRDGGLQQHSQEEERHERDHQHLEDLAVRAPQEPLPHQGREDHAGHHHQDDPHAGVHLVRQRQEEAKEGEQDDLVPQEQGRRGPEGRP